MSQIILILLFFALLWTYITMIVYFYKYIFQQSSDRHEIVIKVFDETDFLDK
jgi:hypothetical protein